MLIGIGGAAGAGKDAFADALVERHGFVKIGMSDPLRDALLTLNPLVTMKDAPVLFCRDGSYLYTSSKTMRLARLVNLVGYTEAKRVPEVRRLLQVLGTDVVRDMIGKDSWVNVVYRNVRECLKAEQSVVVTSIRFPNELALIQQLAGRTVHIQRPDAAPLPHSSDNSVALAEFDYRVENDGTLADLAAMADHIMAEVALSEARYPYPHFTIQPNPLSSARSTP